MPFPPGGAAIKFGLANSGSSLSVATSAAGTAVELRANNAAGDIVLSAGQSVIFNADPFQQLSLDGSTNQNTLTNLVGGGSGSVITQSTTGTDIFNDPTQALDLSMNGRTVAVQTSSSQRLAFFQGAGPASGNTQQTVVGSRVANPALASLLTALASYGILIDATTV
jgi:hypothetical protein